MQACNSFQKPDEINRPKLEQWNMLLAWHCAAFHSIENEVIQHITGSKSKTASTVLIQLFKLQQMNPFSFD